MCSPVPDMEVIVTSFVGGDRQDRGVYLYPDDPRSVRSVILLGSRTPLESSPRGSPFHRCLERSMSFSTHPSLPLCSELHFGRFIIPFSKYDSLSHFSTSFRNTCPKMRQMFPTS